MKFVISLLHIIRHIFISLQVSYSRMCAKMEACLLMCNIKFVRMLHSHTPRSSFVQSPGTLALGPETTLITSLGLYGYRWVLRQSVIKQSCWSFHFNINKTLDSFQAISNQIMYMILILIQFHHNWFCMYHQKYYWIYKLLKYNNNTGHCIAPYPLKIHAYSYHYTDIDKHSYTL